MADVFDENSIPGLDLDVESIDSNASTLKTKAGDLRTAGSTIKTTWAGMSSCYKAPEQETLYAAMNPVETNTDDLADDLEKIAGYVDTFADEARRIKSDAQILKKDGQAFKKKIAAKPDWQYDQDLVNENTRLVNRASELKIRLWDAERTCANDIRALDHLAPYHADPKNKGDKLWYGYSSVPAEAEKPWGKSVDRKDHCPKKAAVSVKRFVWDGVIVDGLGGTINGLVGLVGCDFSGNGEFWSLDQLTNTWSSMGGLIGYGEDENGEKGWSWKTFRTAWKETAKAAVHADQPDGFRAAGAGAFDVVTLIIPLVGQASKVGKVGKAGSAVSKAGKAAQVAAKALDVLDPVGAALAKPLGKVTQAVFTRVLPDFDITDVIAKWTGAEPDVKVGAESGSGFDMNNPDASGMKIGGDGRTSGIDMDDSSVPDVSSGRHDAGEGVSTDSSGRHDLGNSDAAHADAGHSLETSSQSKSSPGVSDASGNNTDDTARAANDGAPSSEGSAARDGDTATDKNHVRQVADADGADGSDRGRAGRDADAETGRDKAAGDTSDGHERHGDADGAESGRNKADGEAEPRDADSGDGKSDGDGSGEDSDKKPLTVEERQDLVDRLHKGRDQDTFNQKHRTVGADAEVKVVEPGDELYPQKTKPFGVGVELDANTHYEVTRTTKSGVNYKTHYYTDASGEIRHVGRILRR